MIAGWEIFWWLALGAGLQYLLWSLLAFYIGDIYWGLALALSLDLSPRSRWLVLGLSGLWQGYFSYAGVWAGLLAALATAKILDFCLQKLDLSLWYPAVLTLGLASGVWVFLWAGVLPHLVEIPLPSQSWNMWLRVWWGTWIWAIFWRGLKGKFFT